VLLGVDNDLYNKLLFMFCCLAGILQQLFSGIFAYYTVPVVIKKRQRIRFTYDKITYVKIRTYVSKTTKYIPYVHSRYVCQYRCCHEY